MRRTGLNPKTADNIVFDSGTVYLNYDNPDKRKKLGACREGSSFSLETEYRDIPVDGVSGAVKGLRRVLSTTASISVNLLEISKEILSIAIPGSSINQTEAINEEGEAITSEVYYEISRILTGVIPDFEYNDIAIVCTYGKSKSPIIFGVKDAMVNTGLSLDFQDANEAVIKMTFTGMIDPNKADEEPWFIRKPEPVGSGQSLKFDIKTSEDLTKAKELLG